MQNGYLIPANSKRGNLIFNIFRPVDLVIFMIGVGITLLSLMIFRTSNTVLLFVILAPAAVSSALVLPVPNQHNVLVLLGAIFMYFTKQHKFKWKGWSIYEKFEQEK